MELLGNPSVNVNQGIILPLFLKDVAQLFITATARVEFYWNFYVVMLLALIGWMFSTKKPITAHLKLLITAGYIVFVCMNLIGLWGSSPLPGCPSRGRSRKRDAPPRRYNRGAFSARRLRRCRAAFALRRQTGRLQLGLKPPAGSDAAAEVVEGIPLGCQRRVTSSTGLAWSHCFSSPLHFLSYNFHHCHFLFSFVKFQCATRFQSINRRFPHQEPCPRHRRVPLSHRRFVKFQNDAPRLLQPRPSILLKSRHGRVCLASRQRCTTAVFWWNPMDPG